jgi:signal transduction histidine kinase
VWALFVGVWALLGLFDATHTGLRDLYHGRPVDWGPSIVFHLALWYAWGLLSLPAVLFARRFPIRRGNWWHRLPLALAAAVLLALVKLVLDYPVVEAFYCPEPGLMSFAGFYRAGFAGHFHPYVMTAVAMLGVLYAWTYFREGQRRELAAWQLEARLAQAQLELLRMQLHPHFLSNALHAVSHLIRRDPDEADRVLARLGELLRLMLDTAGEQEVTLGQELDFLRAYLDIERARFGSRLSVALDVEPGLLDALVPPLILQPIVENAVRHGIARADRPGQVAVRARRRGERLRLEVWDDGPGLAGAAAGRTRKSIGLANTRARLAQLFGAEHHFEVRAERVGVLAAMEFPLALDRPCVHNGSGAGGAGTGHEAGALKGTV